MKKRGVSALFLILIITLSVFPSVQAIDIDIYGGCESACNNGAFISGQHAACMDSTYNGQNSIHVCDWVFSTTSCIAYCQANYAESPKEEVAEKPDDSCSMSNDEYLDNYYSLYEAIGHCVAATRGPIPNECTAERNAFKQFNDDHTACLAAGAGAQGGNTDEEEGIPEDGVVDLSVVGEEETGYGAEFQPVLEQTSMRDAVREETPLPEERYKDAVETAREDYLDKKQKWNMAWDAAKGTPEEQNARKEYEESIKNYDRVRNGVMNTFDPSGSSKLIDPSRASKQQLANMERDSARANALMDSLDANQYSKNFQGKDKKTSDMLDLWGILKTTNDPKTAADITKYLSESSSSIGRDDNALNVVKLTEQKAKGSNLPSDSDIFRTIGDLKTNDLVVNGEFMNAQKKGVTSGAYVRQLGLDAGLEEQVIGRLKTSELNSQIEQLNVLKSAKISGINDQYKYGQIGALMEDPKGPLVKAVDWIWGDGKASDIVPKTSDEWTGAAKQVLLTPLALIGDNANKYIMDPGLDLIRASGGNQYGKKSEEIALEKTRVVEETFAEQKTSFEKFSKLNSEDAQRVLDVARQYGTKDANPIMASSLKKEYGLVPQDLINLRDINEKSRGEIYTQTSLLNAKNDKEAFVIATNGAADKIKYNKKDIENTVLYNAGINPETGENIGGGKVISGILQPVTTLKGTLNSYMTGDYDKYNEGLDSQQKGLQVLSNILATGKSSDIGSWKGNDYQQTMSNLKSKGMTLDLQSAEYLQSALDNNAYALGKQADESYSKGDYDTSRKIQAKILENSADYHSRIGDNSMAVQELMQASTLNPTEKGKYETQISKVQRSQAFSDLAEVGSLAGDFVVSSAGLGYVGKGLAAGVVKTAKATGAIEKSALIEKWAIQAAEESRAAQAGKMLENIENRGFATKYLYGEVPIDDISNAKAAYAKMGGAVDRASADSAFNELKTIAEKNSLENNFLYAQSSAAKEVLRPLEMLNPLSKAGAKGTLELSVASGVGGILGGEDGSQTAVEAVIAFGVGKGAFLQGLGGLPINALATTTEYGKASTRSLESFSRNNNFEKSWTEIDGKRYELGVNNQNHIELSTGGKTFKTIDNLEDLSNIQIRTNDGLLSELNREVLISKTEARNDYAKTALDNAEKQAIKTSDNAMLKSIQDEKALLDSGKQKEISRAETTYAQLQLADAISMGKSDAEISRLNSDLSKKVSDYQNARKDYYSRAEGLARADLEKVSMGRTSIVAKENGEATRVADRILADKKVEVAEITRLKAEADYLAKKEGMASTKEIEMAQKEFVTSTEESFNTKIERTKILAESLESAKKDVPWYDFMRGTESDRAKMDRQIELSKQEIQRLESARDSFTQAEKLNSDPRLKKITENIEALDRKLENVNSDTVDKRLAEPSKVKEDISDIEQAKYLLETKRENVLKEIISQKINEVVNDFSGAYATC